jgi:hypothetical protein
MLNLNYSDDENRCRMKSDFILSICELIVGGKTALQPVEKTVIDVRETCLPGLMNDRARKDAILEDLYYNELAVRTSRSAVLPGRSKFSYGSLNVFNTAQCGHPQPSWSAMTSRSSENSQKIGMLMCRTRFGIAYGHPRGVNPPGIYR